MPLDLVFDHVYYMRLYFPGSLAHVILLNMLLRSER